MRSTMNRRGSARWLALLVVLAIAATACGGSSDDKTSTGPDGTAGSAVDTDGVLKIALGLQGPGGIHFDPADTQGLSDLRWMQLVLGTLLRITPSGGFEGMMAESYELVDPQTVRFTIREGLEFTDGSPYDAQAVMDGLLRTRDQVTPVAKPSQDASIQEISAITVESPTELTVKLKTPVGGQFIAAMGTQSGSIPSPAQVKAAPQDINLKAIGAGPYEIVDVKNGQSITLKRNPDFWDAESWRIGQIEFTDIAESASQVSGLRSGAVDLAVFLAPSDAAALSSDERFGLSSASVENSYFYITMCMSKPPFDNEKVRRALNVGIDRDELNQLVFSGLGRPAYGLWPEGNAYYEPELASMLKHDPEKAKRLLEDSGLPKVEFEMYYPSLPFPEYDRIVEALQGQLSELGVSMKVVAGDPLNDFVIPQKPGALMIPGSRSGVSKYAGVFSPDQRLALCGVSHQEIVDSLQPASGDVPGNPSLAPLFQEADRTIAEHAYLIPLVFAPRIYAYAKDRVGGTLEVDGKNAFPHFDSIYIKK